jgi:hypothetical protein
LRRHSSHLEEEQCLFKISASAGGSNLTWKEDEEEGWVLVGGVENMEQGNERTADQTASY